MLERAAICAAISGARIAGNVALAAAKAEQGQPLGNAPKARRRADIDSQILEVVRNYSLSGNIEGVFCPCLVASETSSRLAIGMLAIGIISALPRDGGARLNAISR